MGAGGNKAAAGGVGGAGFHAVAIRDALEEFVGVFDEAGATVVVFEVVCFRGEVGTEQWAAVSFTGGDSHVACGGILSWLGETVGVFEIGIPHAELRALTVHQCCETFHTPSDITRQCAGDVICTLHHEDFQ